MFVTVQKFFQIIRFFPTFVSIYWTKFSSVKMFCNQVKISSKLWLTNICPIRYLVNTNLSLITFIGYNFFILGWAKHSHTIDKCALYAHTYSLFYSNVLSPILWYWVSEYLIITSLIPMLTECKYKN